MLRIVKFDQFMVDNNRNCSFFLHKIKVTDFIFQFRSVVFLVFVPKYRYAASKL
jgi:hypothetical protein